MLPGLLVPERIRQSLERPRAIDDRPQPRGVNRGNQLLLLPSTAHNQSLQPDLPDHHGGRWNLAAAARQRTDQRNMPTHAGSGNRLDRKSVV